MNPYIRDNYLRFPNVNIWGWLACDWDEETVKIALLQVLRSPNNGGALRNEDDSLLGVFWRGPSNLPEVGDIVNYGETMSHMCKDDTALILDSRSFSSNEKYRVRSVDGTSYPRIEFEDHSFGFAYPWQIKVVGKPLEMSDKFTAFCKKTEIGRKLLKVVVLEDSKLPNFLDFAVENGNKIGYIIKDRLKRFNNSFYDKELRLKFAHMGKPGKVIKRLIPDISNTEVESFSAAVSAEMRMHGDCGLRQSSDLKFAYYGENYLLDREGSLGSSCMKHRRCMEYMDFYVDLNVEVLVLFEEGKIAGRALLWPPIFFPKLGVKKVFMDRVYTHNSQNEELFFEHARQCGFVCKSEQSYDAKHSFMELTVDSDGVYNKKVFTDRIEFPTGITDTDSVMFPYLDTLSFMNNEGIISNMTSGMTMELSDTDGGIDSAISERDNDDDYDDDEWSEDSVYSEWEENDVLEEDSVYSDELGDYLTRSMSVDVTHYAGGYSWMPRNHPDLVEVEGHFYLTTDDYICYSNHTDDYLLSQDAVYSNKLETYIECSGSVEMPDGDSMPEDEVCFSSETGGYLYDDESVYSDRLETNIEAENAVTMMNGDNMPKDHDDVVMIDDEYFFLDDEGVIMSEDGEYYLR